MMFDKKLYVETCSILHASEDTLAEVLKVASQNQRKTKCRFRPAFIVSFALVLLVSSAALAAGSQLLYGGWVHHASLKDAEKMGFHYPMQLGEYRLLESSPSRIHTAPSESGELSAWFAPDYTWMSLEYKNADFQSLSVSFGKMDDPLWAYCFNFDENTGVWLGMKNLEDCASVSTDSRSYIENVTEYVYEDCTIYLADRITEYFYGDESAAAEAHWTDADIGLCFSVSSGDEQASEETNPQISGQKGMTQTEMLNHVKFLIDHNRQQ